jgi:hypothetical protein
MISIDLVGNPASSWNFYVLVKQSKFSIVFCDIGSPFFSLALNNARRGPIIPIILVYSPIFLGCNEDYRESRFHRQFQDIARQTIRLLTKYLEKGISFSILLET